MTVRGLHDDNRLQHVVRMMNVLCSAVSSPPITGVFRLSGPRAPREGILEVYHDGIWGTVCGKDFGDVEAAVACYSMGYGSASYLLPALSMVVTTSVHTFLLTCLSINYTNSLTFAKITFLDITSICLFNGLKGGLYQLNRLKIPDYY